MEVILSSVTFPFLSEKIGTVRVDSSNTKENPLPPEYLFDDFLYDIQTIIKFSDETVLALTSARILPLLWESPFRCSVTKEPCVYSFDACRVSISASLESYDVEVTTPSSSLCASVSHSEMLSWVRTSFGMVYANLVERYKSNVLPPPVEAYFSTLDRLTADFSTFPLALG